MGMMYIHHPDILKFLHAKEDLSQFTNYNISVKVTDEWMRSFLEDPDAPHVVKNPRTGKEYYLPADLKIWEYDIRSLIPAEAAEVCHRDTENQAEQAPGAAIRILATKLVVGVYTRQGIWDIILKNAHRTGEPGVVFIDRINEDNPTPHVGRIEATNPCGEQPLLPYEACNLGSINLAAFVGSDGAGEAQVDWDGLRETVHETTRFLDNVIDVNNYPLPEIDAICKANRKIGLGVMGFADALYMLGVPYDSAEGVTWGKRFMQFVDEESHNYGEELARTRGCFPNWAGSSYDTKHHRPMRNATCTTVAPTGTISIIAGCSGGIEPMYSLAFFRNVLRGQEEGKAPMVQVNTVFETIARARGFLSEGLMERLATDGTLAHADDVPDEIKRVFVCAHDITPDWHMRMQAAFQEHCDASISKTINFPESATVGEVAEIYRLAYELRCKGVTVYRNGCRKHQPMALRTSDGSSSRETAPEAPRDTRPRALEPEVLPEISAGVRVRQLTPFGNMHINITVDPKAERELEVFAQLGKGGDLANSDLEAVCRMISLWLRSGGTLGHVVRQLHSIGSSLQVHTKEGKIMSLGDGLARGLKRYLRAKTEVGLRALLLGEAAPSGQGQVAAGGNGKKGNGKHGASPKADGGVTVADTPAPGNSAGRIQTRNDGMGIQWQQNQYKVVCPDCQGQLYFSEGCVTCKDCGFSKC